MKPNNTLERDAHYVCAPQCCGVRREERFILVNFDIKTLLDFQPAEYLCEKCLALLSKVPRSWKGETLKCPICQVTYLPTDGCKSWQLDDYLRSAGSSVNFKSLIDHSKTLAAIAKRIIQRNDDYPPLRGLFQALNSAQHFVHFTTYGISHLLIGALKMVSYHAKVRGIVSNVDANTLNELRDFTKEAPDFSVQAYGSETSWKDMPHQKLIVVDGLLAFKGSANLTLNAWRKVAAGRDMVEVVTNVDEVINLHNRYFSPIWAELSSVGQEIEMWDVPF